MAVSKIKIVLAVLILASLAVWYAGIGTSGSAEPKKEIPALRSVAILPFSNTTKDSSQRNLDDALTEDILRAVGGIKGLRVSSRNSSFQYRDKNVDVENIGNELHVQAILQGNIEIGDDRITVTTQLTNTADGIKIWSKQFDERTEDLFVIKDKIAKTLAEELKFPIENFERRSANPISKNAYDYYLKGRAAWNLRTASELKNAIEFFRNALRVSPSYAEAYSGIADCHNALGYASFVAPAESFPKAKEAALKALELDSALAEPHAALGFYYFYYEWDWATAEQEFRMAIGSNPNYSLGYIWYAYFLTAMTRYDEAIAMLQKGMELDPLSVAVHTDLGFSLYYGGQYDRALQQLNAALDKNIAFAPAHLWAGRVYQEQKMYKEAVKEYKKTIAMSNRWPVAYAALGNVYGIMGEKSNAVQVLDTLNILKKNKFITSYGVALVYAGTDDEENAFKWLNKAYDERSNWLVWLRTDPRWGSVRNDRRFAELVEKIGLPSIRQ